LGPLNETQNWGNNKSLPASIGRLGDEPLETHKKGLMQQLFPAPQQAVSPLSPPRGEGPGVRGAEHTFKIEFGILLVRAAMKEGTQLFSLASK